MPKYFMTGTKHEAFERMMMSPSRKDIEPSKKNAPDDRQQPTNNGERSTNQNAVSCDTE